MAGLVRYGKILRALGHPKHKAEGGIQLLFEQYRMTLCHKHYVLAMFSLLSLRPTHRGLSTEFWLYIQKAEAEGNKTKLYIYEYAEYLYTETLYGHTFEEKTKAVSIANRRKKSTKYKGEILAINIKTKEEIILVGPEEMEAIGLKPRMVYHCVAGGGHTYNGYVFVRLLEGGK